MVDTVLQNSGAGIVPFDYDNNTWLDLPDDMELETTIELPVGGIWEYASESTGRRFLLYWWDYEPSTAPDGSRRGNHHFCGMYEVTRP